jgi:hypothetical protein|tara:strand:- start:71 stop:370 length:300 start_codon:yes stop_codon:yes gene_type:complete
MSNFVLQEIHRNKLVNDADFRQECYLGMQLYASAVQEIISGSSITIPQSELDDLSNDFKLEIVNNHVSYLSEMVNQDFWTTEDMTTVNNAITSGNAYTS